MKFLRFIVVCLFLSLTLGYGQTIFPGLSGQRLLDSLVARYKPNTTLGYTGARNYMFTVLDNHNDSVTCVYTGFRIYLNHNSSNAIQEALARGINTEHTWPQSLGATGLAKSNLHHLFPTRTDVNSARGSLPFAEIPDAQTDKWYRLDYMLTYIPVQFIDEYSELKINQQFEPREDHKGNVARAMFYFYTMYKDQANSADPTFFPLQKYVLRSWNSMDPVDAAEIARTNMIASQQEGKPNPFVLDTSLIRRAYFALTTVHYPRPVSQTPDAFKLYPNFPNPFNNETDVRFYLPRPGSVQLAVYSVSGQALLRESLSHLPQGFNRFHLREQQWATGFYFIAITFDRQVAVQKILFLR